MPQLNTGAIFEVAAYDRANVKLLATGRVIALDSLQSIPPRSSARSSTIPHYALFPNQFVNAQLLVKTLHGTSWSFRWCAALPATTCT